MAQGKRLGEHTCAVPREKILGFVGGTLAGVALLVWALWPDRPGGQSDSRQPVALVPPIVELRYVFQEQVVRPELRLENRSDDKVKILGASSTCGCTLVPEALLGKVVEPHRSVPVPMEYHSSLTDGPVWALVQVSVAVNGSKYTAAARLEGEVIAEFTMEPKQLDFGKVSPGEQVTKTVVFRPKACGSLRIGEPCSRDQAFEAVILEEQAAGTGTTAKASITFRPPRTAHRQVFGGSVTFSTSSKRIATAIVPVRGEVCPEIDVTPELLVLPARGASGESRLTIRTVEPSRVVRLASQTSEGVTRVIRAVAEEEGDASHGRQTHILTLSNHLLDGAQQLAVMLEILRGADRTEARSVSVQLLRLD